jgi:hypothetical protein
VIGRKKDLRLDQLLLTRQIIDESLAPRARGGVPSPKLYLFPITDPINYIYTKPLSYFDEIREFNISKCMPCKLYCMFDNWRML